MNGSQTYIKCGSIKIHIFRYCQKQYVKPHFPLSVAAWCILHALYQIHTSLMAPCHSPGQETGLSSIWIASSSDPNAWRICTNGNTSYLQACLDMIRIHIRTCTNGNMAIITKEWHFNYGRFINNAVHPSFGIYTIKCKENYITPKHKSLVKSVVIWKLNKTENKIKLQKCTHIIN